MTSKPSMLACEHLWKVFGKDAEDFLATQFRNDTLSDAQLTELGERGIVACADINLDIKTGEFFVLMGLSGSGKSTLMRCLSRLVEPTVGSISLDGEDFLSKSGQALREIRQRKMGMVFQHFGLFPHMTVLDNVAFALKVQGVGKQDRYDKARAMLELVGLKDREFAYPNELSGGQKQRVGIARSLAVDPQVWFLDEPFSALDPLIRWQMQSELLTLQQQFNKTVVFVTHDFMEAVRLADRIAIMKDGSIVQCDTPEKIVLNPADEYVSEFVKEVPRTRILKSVDLMVTGQTHQASADLTTVSDDMTLEEVLAHHAVNGRDLEVINSEGVRQGIIPAAHLANALQSGPRD